MKAWRAVLLAWALIAAGAACRSAAPMDVRVSLPGVTPFPPGTLSTIVVTGFRDEAPLADFTPCPAFEEALVNALRLGLKDTAGLVERAPVEAVAVDRDAAAWKAAGAGRAPGTVFLAGSVRLAGVTLKAIDPKSVSDGPFDLVRRLLSKRRWTLTAEIAVISASTGETLYKDTFRESQDYGELDKPAEFAFSDLSEHIMDRLGEALLGRSSVEVRTLLRR